MLKNPKILNRLYLLKNKLNKIIKTKYKKATFTKNNFIYKKKIKLLINKLEKKNKYISINSKYSKYLSIRYNLKKNILKDYKFFNSHLYLRNEKNNKKIKSIISLIILGKKIFNLKEINDIQKLNSLLKINDIIILTFLETKKVYFGSNKSFQLEEKILKKFI